MQNSENYSCANKILPRIKLLTMLTVPILILSIVINIFCAVILYKTIYKANAKYYFKTIDVIEQVHHVQVTNNSKVLPNLQ